MVVSLCVSVLLVFDSSRRKHVEGFSVVFGAAQRSARIGITGLVWCASTTKTVFSCVFHSAAY